VRNPYTHWVFRTRRKNGSHTYWQVEKCWQAYCTCLNLLIIAGVLIWWLVR